MSDITAVVLTIGEKTTKRAIDSLKKQAVLPKEIIIIRDITPFHKALNLGASNVKTEFFIQVDSDMILDENCLKDLRKYMTENVGIAIGQLRDSLMGVITGVKMFRKKCFEKVQFKNSISPDTDFYVDIEKHGWTQIHLLNSSYTGNPSKLWHTFGEHRPTYTPLYTYSKYYLLGRRYRYRKDLGGLRWRFRELRRNNHNLSLVAEIAMAHGIFSQEENDLLKPSPYSCNQDFDFLDNFLKSEGIYDIRNIKNLPFLALNPKTLFKKLYKLGIDLRSNNSFPAFKYCMDSLNKCNEDIAWIAKVGVCHGIFQEVYLEERSEKEYDLLNEFL